MVYDTYDYGHVHTIHMLENHVTHMTKYFKLDFCCHMSHKSKVI